ncbi:DUF4097 family beta strand repeat-containing protein [Amycolatopsis thermophila]|uniref:DUF4097 domain-containing protein n=1 Tax=Amycolatopsis thermophila TaxID=206084 RepID=A0ABU0EZD1_9PSEU|nr:DUF4097 family beta strand repeat-containing protein [Amycolatopsis thermophila]MDQ0380498.1 hypothetical protein [Amycolatopsis thermophila]
MHTFDTPAPISVALAVPAGRIQVVATNRADTTVEVAPADPGKKRDVRIAGQITVTYADGVLRIQAPEPANQIFGPSGEVAVTVGLPAGSHIRATTACAEFRAAGRLGDVTVDGAYRHIRIDEAATASLTAVDGDVEVRRLGGPADIRTARGDIRITEAVRGKVVLSTRSGDIAIAAAAGVSAALDAGTGHGRISNSVRNTGEPGLDIRATTAQGDITARSL